MKTNQTAGRQLTIVLGWILAILMIFAHQGFAGDNGARIKELRSKRKADSGKNAFRRTAKNSGEKSRRSYTDYSQNSDDLNPVKGTTWTFSYNFEDETFTDSLTVAPYAQPDSDEDVYAVCVNDMEASGRVYVLLNTDAGGSSLFLTTVYGEDYYQYYDFEISGTEATGYVTYVFGGDEYEFPATGYKLSSDCISVDSGLSLPVCAEYEGIRYGFTLDYYPNPADTSGFYWKMDVGTFKEK
ncbi:MAG: hypothetical protein R2941_17985 [Desulfobacterales bacterium]